MTYIPQVDDYVRWKDALGRVNEGWIYYVGEEYCTIEIAVKDKPDELGPYHKKIHCLILCFVQQWNELECLKNRRNEQMNGYKAQEYRYSDVQ